MKTTLNRRLFKDISTEEAFRVLVTLILDKKRPVTYTEFADLLLAKFDSRMSNDRKAISVLLERVFDYCLEHNTPCVTCYVVKKGSRISSDGYFTKGVASNYFRSFDLDTASINDIKALWHDEVTRCINFYTDFYSRQEEALLV
jgi:hypothetical protein